MMISILACAGVLLAGTGTNLIANPDMAIEDGVTLPVGWNMTFHPNETGGRIWAEPLADGAFELNVRGRKSNYWWQQNGLVLVPGAKYRYSCEIMTKGAGEFRLYIRNREWSWECKSASAPADTKGAWVSLSLEFEAGKTKFTDDYWVSLAARAGASGSGRALVRGLRLEPLDPSVAGSAKTLPQVCLPARIVPVDPLLSCVDAASGRMRFYWARASRTDGCRLVCSLENEKAREATAAFDAKGFASVSLGTLRPGGHRLTACVRDASGATVVSNSYRITAVCRTDAAKVGRRLNNLVTELVNAPLADGEVAFERADDGWTWISFDGDAGEARGYLDGCLECAVCRREGEPAVESQRYLRAGRHTLRIRGARGGRLRIHAVKVIMGGSLMGFDRAACDFGLFGGYRFGLPFMRKYGLLSGVNMLSSGNVARQLADPFSVAVGTCLARGVQMARSAAYFDPNHPDRQSVDAIYRRITKDIWNGYPGALGIDENQLRSDSVKAINFSEAVWRIAEDYPGCPLNLFYWDTSTGACYDEPRQHASEVASIVNTGSGRGLLCPEFYMPVTATKEEFREYIDICADFIASALGMVPASRGRTLPYTSSYIMLGEWCNYFAPESDIKVHTADLMRAYAVDPRFAECAGMGFGGIGCGNEEYVRWAMRLMRYYALEGGTEDLAAKRGYFWNPGFVKDPDFSRGLDCWKAQAAEPGALAAAKIEDYGKNYQRRVGAPMGRGDTLAKFVVSAKGANVLSQKLTGLVPGAYYSLQFCLTDTLPPDSTDDWNGLTRRPFAFTARLDGGEEVRDLRISHPIRLSTYVPDEVRKRAMMHLERYVFRATAPEATLAFADRGEGPTTEAGRSYLLNYVIFAPYYCDGDEDVHNIAATLRGE